MIFSSATMATTTKVVARRLAPLFGNGRVVSTTISHRFCDGSSGRRFFDSAAVLSSSSSSVPPGTSNNKFFSSVAASVAPMTTSTLDSFTSPWMATNWEKVPPSSKDEEEGSSSASKSKSTTIEIIRDMESFVDSIPDAIRSRKELRIEPGAYNDPVADLFRRSDLPQSEWMKYAIRDESKPYTRNLISTDDETYTLLLLVWNPHQVSPIHNHPCDGCWLNVLQGSIYETRYDDVLNTTSHNSYRSSDETTLSYITDNMGYHRVGNDNREGEIAVTMHLYSPPFDTCRCWDDANDDPTKPREGHNINHSEYGKVVAV